MKLSRIALFFLLFSLISSITGLVVLGFNIPFKFPFAPVITGSSFIFALLHASQREGWAKSLLLVALIIASGLFFESLGVATGLVYGPYHYTDALGPKFLGLVPWIIPVAWTSMMYPSLVIADAVMPASIKGLKRGFVLAAISGVIMTAWDVAMDPMMVLGGNWVWEVEGGYFGVPLQNFWGWWLTTFTAVGLYLLFSRKMKGKVTPMPDRWAVCLYTITGVTSVATCLLVNLNGPALAGLFAMLPWWILGFWRTIRQSSDK